MWHMADGWGWWMFVGWLWMAVFWGLIIWAVVTIVRRDGSSSGRSASDDPLTILERRYAAGEISHEEFEEHRNRIGQRR